jgi:uncharacterized protein (DUF1697 family)
MVGQAPTRAPVYVSLLRGVNVGGKNKLAMADLRLLFESLGLADVRTFIQSGNVIFKSDQVPNSSLLEGAIAERFGIATDVMLRTASELGIVAQRSPFLEDEGTHIYVGFMAREPSKAVVAALDVAHFGAERSKIVGSEVYLSLPSGMGEAKLPSYLTRQLKVPMTVRNWNTVKKLLELSLA